MHLSNTISNHTHFQKPTFFCLIAFPHIKALSGWSFLRPVNLRWKAGWNWPLILETFDAAMLPLQLSDGQQGCDRTCKSVGYSMPHHFLDSKHILFFFSSCSLVKDSCESTRHAGDYLTDLMECSYRMDYSLSVWEAAYVCVVCVALENRLETVTCLTVSDASRSTNRKGLLKWVVSSMVMFGSEVVWLYGQEHD